MTDKIEKKESSELTTESDQLVGVDNIEPLIKIIRGQQVMLDRDLATLYGVETKRLNEQVKRNIKRFPEDFMFSLKKELGIAKVICKPPVLVPKTAQKSYLSKLGEMAHV